MKVTITLPAEWLQNPNRLIGVALGGNGSDFFLMKRDRLAALANDAEQASTLGVSDIHEMSRTLSNLAKNIDDYLGTLDHSTRREATVDFGESPEAYAVEHLNSLAQEVNAIHSWLFHNITMTPDLVGERSLKVALRVLERKVTAVPQGDLEHAVKFLNDLMTPVTRQALATQVETDAKNWLKANGWLTAPED